MRKPAFCIHKNKVANKLYGKRAADQCLYFQYIAKHPKSEILILWPSSDWLYSLVCARPGLKPEDRFAIDTAHLLFL